VSEPRVSPHSLQAEETVLGAILVRPTAVFEVIDELLPRDFYRHAHQEIFKAFIELTEAGVTIDFVTLVELLKQKGMLDEVGGPAYIAQLDHGMPRTANIADHVRIVREMSVRRELLKVTTEITADAYESVELDAILARAEHLIGHVAQRSVSTDFVEAARFVAEGAAEVQRRAERGHALSGISTGYPLVDEMLDGLEPGNVYLLGARPSMGKTSLALNIATAAAFDGKTVAFASLEMSREQLFLRIAASVAHVDLFRLRRGYLSGTEWKRVFAAYGQIADSGFCVDDTSTLNAAALRGKVRRLKARRGVDLVVVDYLQLMHMPEAESRNVAVGEVSRALKLAAKELDVPILALSQLSRGLESRPEKKPALADLRDSGSLEQDADVVLLLYRPEVHDPKPDNAGLAELLIAKQRSGPTGSVRLRWTKEETRFDEWCDR